MTLNSMTSRQRTTILASACLAISLTASILMLRGTDQLRPQATLEDSLYVNSPSVIKRAILGFDGLMACIYWTRTVQYFGGQHSQRGGTYNELAPLLEITTALDPHMIPPYQFGASFLAPAPPNGAGQPARAISLMEYGIAHNPDNWQLYYNLGFVYYTELKDYKDASRIFAQGSEVPNAHPFMKILAARMAQHAGDLSTARMLWSATFETSHDKDIQMNALEHLRGIKVDEDVIALQAAVTRFGERTWHLPASMTELAVAEQLQGLPVDPDNDPYLQTLDGRIEIPHPEDFPFATKGLPAGYKPVPPRFHSKS
jgi:tetratricopeptide (TPR) repeat protein